MHPIVQATLFGAAVFLAVATPLVFLTRRAATSNRHYATPTAPADWPSDYPSDPGAAARLEAWDRAWREISKRDEAL